MSELLEALIEERRNQALEYKDYLEKVKELSVQVVNPGGVDQNAYPSSVDSTAKKALYDNFESDAEWVGKVDVAVRSSKTANWIGNVIKERVVARAIYEAVGDGIAIDEIMKIVVKQHDYQ